MTTTLCEVKVPLTAAQRQDLQRACTRLGLSWPEIVWRVRCAMQDAATRTMVQLIEAPDPPRDRVPGVAPVGDYGVTMTPAPAFETNAPLAGGVEAESAALLADIDGVGDELLSLVERLSALRTG